MANTNNRIIITVSNNLIIDQRVAKLTASLTKRAYNVFLIGRRWPGGDIPPGRKGEHLRLKCLFNKGFLFYATFNIQLFVLLLFKKCSHIISVDLDTLVAARLAGWIKGKPVIFDSHEYFPEIPELYNRPFVKAIWQLIEKFFLPGIDFGITVSPGIQKIYKERYNKSFVLIRNIPDKADDIHEIRPVSKSSVIYYQGALNVGRGLESSILSLKYLPSYKMKIVGGGDIEKKLHELVRKEGLNERVEFTGKVSFEKLHEYALDTHVGLCLLENLGLSYYYSLPNRIFDYPALGLPVIATAFPDIKDIVASYNTGLLINTLDPELIAEAIKKACESKQLRETWKGTLIRAANELNWENEEKVLDLYF